MLWHGFICLFVVFVICLHIYNLKIRRWQNDLMYMSDAATTLASIPRRWCLFLGKWNLHGVCRCDFETLQCLLGGAALQLGGKFHESNIVAIRHQTHLFEARELIEQHGQHHFIRFLWQIGQEENLIWRLFSSRCIIFTWTSALLLFITENPTKNNPTKLIWLAKV